MILSVTLNPLLEKRLLFKETRFNETNRCDEEYNYLGGKGINVCRQLNKLKIKNVALTFIGGNSGKVFRKLLESENIDFSPVQIKSQIREASVIIDPSSFTSYLGKNSVIEKNEIADMIKKIEKIIPNCSAVIFSGSVPNEDAAEVIKRGIELAHQHDKVSILDTHGAHLKECLDLGPTVVHNNIDELNSSLNLNIKTDEEKSELLKNYYKNGTRLAFITDGPNPTIASKFDFIYKIINPKVECYNATGSGDAFVAGIIHGMEKALVFDEFVKRASAIGAVNTLSAKVCEVDEDEIQKYFDEITIEPLGKKMKIIDDSPNY